MQMSMSEMASLATRDRRGGVQLAVPGAVMKRTSVRRPAAKPVLELVKYVHEAVSNFQWGK